MESKSADILIKQDLLSSLLDDIQNPKGGDFTDRLAWLIGFSDNPSTILNYIKLSAALINILNASCQSNQLKTEIDEILSLLPFNITCNGLVVFVEQHDKSQQDETAKTVYGQLQGHSAFKDRPLTFLFIKSPETEKKEFQAEDFYCVRVEGNDLRSVGISLDKQETALFEVSKQYFSLLTSFSVPVVFDSTVDEVLGNNKGNVGDELSNAVLNFKNTEILFSLNESEIDIGKDKIKEALKSIKQNAKKSKDEYSNFLSFIPVQEAVLLFSKKPRGDIHPNGIIIEKNQRILSNEFELLGYFRYDADLRDELRAFGKYLNQKVAGVVSSQLNNPTKARSQNVLTYCNSFSGVGSIISLPNGKDEENSEIRRRYHQRLHFPLDRPLLRRDDSLGATRRSIEADTSGKLRDVHYGLTTKGVPDGKKYLIQGSYIYYHYMQDGFDDQGWGCAYRSLQTLLSWFKVQRQVPDFKVPSIPEIQKLLVEMGDKPREFVGSKEWIGAIEVNLVLNKLLGVESKIMFMSSGSEIPSKARELKEHFMTEGTPIMIGGGVLAYTLLGIDYNEDTGDVKYLILDPHFTGSDNLKTIQEKGWIGWKEGKLFLDHAFYNFCLPQRKKFI